MTLCMILTPRHRDGPRAWLRGVGGNVLAIMQIDELTRMITSHSCPPPTPPLLLLPTWCSVRAISTELGELVDGSREVGRGNVENGKWEEKKFVEGVVRKGHGSNGRNKRKK